VPDETSKTVPDLFLERVGRSPGAEAFRYPGAGSGKWESLSWSATEGRVRALAAGLRSMGVEPEQVCAILSATRIEWILADLGILCAGACTSAIYPSSTAEECAYILGDSRAVVAFVDTDEQALKLASRRSELPALRKVIVFEGQATPDGWVMPFADFEEQGRARDRAHPGSFEETATAVREGDLATLLYTSGTTGRPKGVELSHRCWVSQSLAVERSGILDHPDAFQFFWLPLAHSFGKMIGTAQLRLGFPTAVDGRIDKIVENLAHIRPTFVCAVPRIFEKVHANVLARVREGGAVQAAVFRWAMEAGLAARRAERAGNGPGPLAAAQRALADRLVFSRIRSLFGGRLQFFVSGSAPLAREVTEFFDAMGVAILEGYGLTETSAATHANTLTARRIGTVGRALPGLETRIAEDGEVLLRGAWVMRGYHGLPEATAEALDGEGWLHTGDVGQVDGEGYLTITDRKKDLIKTSGGKYIAPGELEARIKTACPLLSQVLVHGDRRNFVSALMTLDPEAARKWAAVSGFEDRDPAALSRLAELHAVLQRGLDKVNASLPRYATVKKFRVLPAEFTEAAGEVTASQKLKRKVIEARYQAELNAMYQEPPPQAAAGERR
jgi:long-chain acyl-CoA synthetase